MGKLTRRSGSPTSRARLSFPSLEIIAFIILAREYELYNTVRPIHVIERPVRSPTYKLSTYRLPNSRSQLLHQQRAFGHLTAFATPRPHFMISVSRTLTLTKSITRISRFQGCIRSFANPALNHAPTMTTGVFRYIDPATISDKKPWAKVDVSAASYTYRDENRPVSNMRTQEPSYFGTDKSGFAVYHSPATERSFTDDTAVRQGYYSEVEALLKAKLPGVKKVVLFDHTIRRRRPDAPRQPVAQVHVDQTPGAAAARVRRHLPAGEAEELLKGRYQIINVWRPIGHVASDHPLAVVDWRTTGEKDFVPVDLLYPARGDGDDGDDRGKEVLATRDLMDTEGYEVKGETFAVRPAEGHRFWYYKDMTPEEVMFIKCFDSRSKTMTGRGDVAHCTPHTAFEDPETPKNAKGRESIEVRCLVFYE